MSITSHFQYKRSLRKPYFHFCSGRWRKRKRYGAGLISGKALEARGVKEIWGKYQSGVLEGPAKVTLAHGDCILEGNFVNGKLHGPVRGLTKRGRHHFSNLPNSKIVLPTSAS